MTNQDRQELANYQGGLKLWSERGERITVALIAVFGALIAVVAGFSAKSAEIGVAVAIIAFALGGCVGLVLGVGRDGQSKMARDLLTCAAGAALLLTVFLAVKHDWFSNFLLVGPS